MRLVTASLAASVATALLFACLVLVSARRAATEEIGPAQPPPCVCSAPQQAPRAAPRPKLAEHTVDLDDSDEIATLAAIHVALTEVADGSSYVWHRRGLLSAVIQPTASFKDASGRVCRHIVMVLTTGRRSGRVEGVACRLGGGRWQLEG